MRDSNARDHLDAKHERNREQRIEGIKRWVEYIESEPPETWGPQQNAVVNGQIESAQAVDVSAEDRTRIREFARAELTEETDSETEHADRSDTE
jgi:hypothetical protein